MAKPRSGFVAPYKWDESRIVMIKHKHGGFLRANPKNHQECNFKGGQTDWSKWQIYFDPNDNTIVQIQNIKTKKYLEIDKHGKYVSVANDGGASSKFIRHPNTSNYDINNGNNNNNNAITPNPNTNTNSNDNDNDNNDNDVDDDDDNKMNDNNNTPNQPAASSASTSTNPPMNSIIDDGVKLESHRCRGLYLCVHPNDGVYISSDINNSHSILYFLIHGKTDEGLFKKPYLLTQQNTIIISHAFGGSIRVNNQNENIVDSKGDKDILSRWEALPNDNGDILQFRNVKSGAFLRIVDSKVSCCDAKSDPNTKFRVHVVQTPNIVKLESVTSENQFISVRQKGLCIGNGGPHCQMTLYQKD